MIDSLQGSFMVFISCVVMMALYLSVFAIFFVQGMTSKLEEDSSREPIPPWLKDAIDADFSNVTDAMMTLFMSLTGGNDWVEYYRTIQELGSVYSVLFIFF